MMNLELDHILILTDKPKEAGDLLVLMGLKESFSRDHKGQGTSNRRFEFSNGMLELLYVRDRDEANNGPASNLKFPERTENKTASPFGIVLNRTDDLTLDMPFGGWAYQPDYFESPNAFHIGNNSDQLDEPLCIYIPFMSPINRKEEAGLFKFISNVQVLVPVDEFSDTLRVVQAADRVEIESAGEHLVVLTLDRGCSGLSNDFRPALPLIINW